MLDIPEYVSFLEQRLRIEPQKRSEVLSEVWSHVMERAGELRQFGLPPEVADQHAIRDFGDPKSIADQFYAAHSTGNATSILLAMAPHLILAAIFVLHLWTDYFWVAAALAVATLFTVGAWRRGLPLWTYPWVGYAVLLPALTMLLAFALIGYGLIQHIQYRSAPLTWWSYALMALWIPIATAITVMAVRRAVRHDWIVVSFAALPVPFLTLWFFALHWHGGVLVPNLIRTTEVDSATSSIFLALAVTTALFMRVGHRLWRVVILAVPSPVLAVVAFVFYAQSVANFDIFVAFTFSAGFLLSPSLFDRMVRRAIPRYLSRLTYPTAPL